jgi:spore germination protein
MSIREKLLDLKRRLSDRKMYSIVLVIIGAVAIWGISEYKQASNLRQKLDNQYNRAFYEMTGYVNNVEVLLVKSLVATTPVKVAGTMQEAWRQANLAQANLGQLPVTQPVLANTSKFLTQLGDFSYSLNNQNMGGKPLSEEQYKTIEQLSGYATTLNQSLSELQNLLYDGRLKWGELENKGSSIFQKTSSQMPVQQFENIDKTFKDYPKLIYDGPFSDHLTGLEPKALTGDNIDEEQGKQKAADFFCKDKVRSVESTGKADTQPFATYTYKVLFNDVPDEQSASISITQKGGHVLWMLYNRPSQEKKVNVEQAKQLAGEFLASRGYENMADTYYIKEDNNATINFAYKQDDVIAYPDLIKVKIALDNGEIVGFESKGYLSSHTVRDIAAPGITMEEARTHINTKMNIKSSGMALIPTEYRTELFCYEFKGKLNDKDFIVYINAENGKEEDILLIINTEDGILTM